MAHPRKILTVILLSAGCGTTPTPSAQRTSTSEVPVPTVAATAAAAKPAAAPRTPPTPLADDAQPQAILDLRVELYRGGQELASTSPARFRPLCDAEGYPLVGNVANKGAMYSVAEYCTVVRAAGERPDA